MKPPVPCRHRASTALGGHRGTSGDKHNLDSTPVTPRRCSAKGCQTVPKGLVEGFREDNLSCSMCFEEDMEHLIDQDPPFSIIRQPRYVLTSPPIALGPVKNVLQIITQRPFGQIVILQPHQCGFGHIGKALSRRSLAAHAAEGDKDLFPDISRGGRRAHKSTLVRIWESHDSAALCSSARWKNRPRRFGKQRSDRDFFSCRRTLSARAPEARDCGGHEIRRHLFPSPKSMVVQCVMALFSRMMAYA